MRNLFMGLINLVVALLCFFIVELSSLKFGLIEMVIVSMNMFSAGLNIGVFLNDLKEKQK